MNKKQQTPSGFDEWHALATSNPTEFENRRQALIAAAIAEAPPERRERLEKLQWRIDQVRARHRDPLAACVHLSRMMWQTVHGEHGLLAHVELLRSRWTRGGATALPQATILPFRKPRDRSHS